MNVWRPVELALSYGAAIGLGAPLMGDHGYVDLALVQRHTAISQKIAPPAYPWAVDDAAAARGAATYAKSCAACPTRPCAISTNRASCGCCSRAASEDPRPTGSQ